MRLAFIYDRVWPYSKGGVERRYRCMADALAARGHFCLLVGAKEWDGPRFRKDGGVWLYGVDAAPSVVRDARWALRYGRALAKALPDLPPVDVVDFNAFPFLPLWLNRHWLTERPHVVSWTEWYDHGYWRSQMGLPRALMADALERRCLSIGDAFVTLTPFTTRTLRRMGATQPVHELPTVLPLVEIAAAEPAAERFDLAFVGRLMPAKRVDLLIRSLAWLRERGERPTLAVVGDGSIRPDLTRMAEALVPGQVRFLGRLPDVEMYGVLKASRLLVHPSQQEGLGLVALEAMACGLPVVAADWPNSAVPTLINPGLTGFPVKPHPYFLASAIETVLGNEARRRQMGECAKISVGKYSNEAMGAAAERVYRTALRDAGIAMRRRACVS